MPEAEAEPEPERSEMPAEEQAPPEEETEATVKDAPDADPKQLDFLKLLQKKSSKKKASFYPKLRISPEMNREFIIQ